MPVHDVRLDAKHKERHKRERSIDCEPARTFCLTFVNNLLRSVRRQSINTGQFSYPLQNPLHHEKIVLRLGLKSCGNLKQLSQLNMEW